MHKRKQWVDYVKVVACILVVTGHFFQSMVKADIISDSVLYEWFNTTIYYFHVPLFFICSGYLYQKFSKVDSFERWYIHITKKLVALGIPYFVFSVATWILKKVFSSSVNSEIDGLKDTLFIQPASPYWYLYVLFFIFLITITFNNINVLVIYTVFALGLRMAQCFGLHFGIYCIDKTIANWIWLVIGMLIAYYEIDEKIEGSRKSLLVGIVFGIVFLTFSILNVSFLFFSVVMGLFACIAVILTCISFGKPIILLDIFSKYTMPVFLMHTLFAAPLRSVLLKFGIQNSVVHIVAGLTISFIGPVIAIKIMEKIKLDILVYPNRYIKIGRR